MRSAIDPAFKLDGKTGHEIKIVRVGGQVEMFLDDTRIAHMPLPDQVKRVGFSIEVAGMKVDIVGLGAFELSEKTDY